LALLSLRAQVVSGVSSKSTSWGRKNHVFPRFAMFIALLLLLAGACSRSVSNDDIGIVDLVHQDGRPGISVSTEGALALVRITKGDRNVVDEVVLYPASAEESVSGRHTLLRGARLPVGELALTFEVRPCTGSCPDANISEFENLQTAIKDVCELTFTVRAGRSVALVSTPPGAPCEFTVPRRGSKPVGRCPTESE